MRFFFGVLTTFAAFAVGTTASEASVITFVEGHLRQDLQPLVVPSTTLQQLLELQFASSTSSTLQSSDESDIELLEKLSGRPSPLFGNSDVNGALDKVLVILEGLSDEIASSIRNEYRKELVISQFAVGSARDTFREYLLKARPEGIVSPESTHCVLSGHGNREPEAVKDFVTCLPEAVKADRDLFAQAKAGESWIDSEGTAVVHATFEVAKTKATLFLENGLSSLFSNMQSLSAEGKKVTVVLSGSATTQKSRRTPGVESVDSSRNRVKDNTVMGVKQRAQAQLSSPVCYSSNTSCNDATDTCSGHGACYKKSGDCYACRCYEAGWGGSACQKKDVSSPFFLILGVTIGIVVTIGSAIGMLFRIGNTELPGVISAGVGVAGAQK
ncbi:hypothetical protein BDV18DRAFT_46365 [Aspergillus unguis]